MTRGVIFGKFMPPTMGHKSMIDAARRQVDRLFVFVGDVYEDDLVPRRLRAEWLQMHYGDAVQVVAPSQDALTEEISSDDLLKRWQALVLEVIGGPPDRLFGSEAYLAHIAASFGAEFILVDERRGAVPISATQIRADPIGHWDMILPEARGSFRREVIVVAQPGQEPPLGEGIDIRDLRDPARPGATRNASGPPNKLLITLVRPDQVAAMRARADSATDREWRWFAGPVPVVALQPVRTGIATPSATTAGVEILSPDAFAAFIRQQLGASPLPCAD